jgi:hypothetical protein
MTGLSFFIRVLLLIMLLIAVGNLPYGYFEFLRVWVSVSGIFLLLYELKQPIKTLAIYFYIGLILLFNPISPLYFSKSTWIFLDILSVILICISFYLESRRQDNTKEEEQ